jgi:putative membrane protein
MGALNPQLFLSSLIYSVLGTVLFIAMYKLMEKVFPFNLTKELAEDHNVAVGVLMGSMMIGLAIIIASAIHG